MGWEWRVFFPLEPGGAPDIWSLLFLPSPERRTDVYLACTHAAGLKVRGARLLEVKLRIATDRESGAEQWKKIVSSPATWDGKDVPALCALFAKQLEDKKKERKFSVDLSVCSMLEEALSSLSTPPHYMVQLDKERHTRHSNRVDIEQTDITVSGRQDGTQTVTGRWRSVSVEGALEDIKKFLDSKVQPPGSERALSLGDHLIAAGGQPRGYAQFVMDLMT